MTCVKYAVLAMLSHKKYTSWGLCWKLEQGLDWLPVMSRTKLPLSSTRDSQIAWEVNSVSGKQGARLLPPAAEGPCLLQIPGNPLALRKDPCSVVHLLSLHQAPLHGRTNSYFYRSRHSTCQSLCENKPSGAVCTSWPHFSFYS